MHWRESGYTEEYDLLVSAEDVVNTWSYRVSGITLFVSMSVFYRPACVVEGHRCRCSPHATL